MRLQDIPKHWKERIARDPGSDFAKKAIAIQKKIHQENIRENYARNVDAKSRVGTILLSLFKRVGGVPCGDCRQTLLKLNKLTVEEIHARHDEIVFEIEKNSKKAKAALWAKLLMHIDQFATDGQVARMLISRWLNEACELDVRSSENQDILLDGDIVSAGMGVSSEQSG